MWLSLSKRTLVLTSADGLAYSALLKNELLGAGIEKVQDPQSEDRRLQPSTPAKRSLFNVRTLTWLYHSMCNLYVFHMYKYVSAYVS